VHVKPSDGASLPNRFQVQVFGKRRLAGSPKPEFGEPALTTEAILEGGRPGARRGRPARVAARARAQARTRARARRPCVNARVPEGT
jgi:hypothetical protein